MAYDKATVFNRLGALVRWHGQIESFRSVLDADLMSEIYTDFGNSGPDDRQSIRRIYDQMELQRESMEADKHGVVAQVGQFITGPLAGLLGSPEKTVDKVVKDLIAAMNGAGDTVDGNTVYNKPASATNNDGEMLTVHDEEGDPAGAATLDAVDQMARPGNAIRAVCVADAQAGHETWAVYSSVLGEAPTQAVTGQDWRWPAAGIRRLNIAEAAVAQTGSGNVISDPDVQGVRRGVNADEDGVLYLATSRLVTANTVRQDEFNQLDFAFTTPPVFGEDTDTDGRLHVAIDADPDAMTVSGGATAAVSGVALAGVDDDNTDAHGLIYVKVTQSGGAHYVTLYRNIDRQTAGDKVASGSTAGLPAQVTLSQENSSGLSGVLILESYQADDDTIVIRPPKYHVRLYRSADRGEEALRAHAATFDPNVYGSPIALAAANGSAIAGTVTLTYAKDDSDVTLQLPYYLIHFYADSGRENLVARAGSLSPGDGLPIHEVGGSGLSGTIDLDGIPAVSDIELAVGYSAGDHFEFATHSLEEGTFQSFFRDNLGHALPAVTNGTETVSDALAGGD